VAVVLPRLQYRVADPQNQRANTILQTRTVKKRLTPLFDFGLTHAPIQAEGLDGKNTIVGKYCGTAATSHNRHIAKIATLPSFENNC
jgi:hypothetical protein